MEPAIDNPLSTLHHWPTPAQFDSSDEVGHAVSTIKFSGRKLWFVLAVSTFPTYRNHAWLYQAALHARASVFDFTSTSPRPSQHVSCLLWHVTTAVQLMEQIGEWSALDSRTQFLLNTSPSPPALTCASKHHNNKTWTNASELTHAALVVKFVRSMFRCT